MNSPRRSRNVLLLVGVALVLTVIIHERYSLFDSDLFLKETPRALSQESISREPFQESPKQPVSEQTNILGRNSDSLSSEQMSLLCVRDKDTNRELEGVYIRTGDTGTNASIIHPGSNRGLLICKAETSPVTIPANTSNTIWVCAAEYAWQQVELDKSDDDPQIVHLERGGELEVQLEPLALCKSLTVTLRDPAYAPMHSPVRPLVDGEHVLELDVPKDRAIVRSQDKDLVIIRNLKTGSYEIKAHSMDGAFGFSEHSVDVTAGARGFVRIVMSERYSPKRHEVPLAGTLRLPPGCKSVPVELELISSGSQVGRLRLFSADMIPHGGDSLFLSWDAGNVLPGPWRAQIYIDDFKSPYSIPFQLGDRGRRDVNLEVPALADLNIRVVDAETCEPVDIGSLMLGWEPIKQQSTLYNMRGIRKKADKTYTAKIPSGRIILDVSDVNYYIVASVQDETYLENRIDNPMLREVTRLTVRPGRNNIVLKVCRNTLFSFHLQLCDESGHIRMPIDFWSRVRVLIDKTTLVHVWHSNGKFIVPHAGTYQVRIPPVEGYDLSPVHEVTINSEEVVELLVELKRLR